MIDQREYLPDGDELRARRIKAGLTQADVGRRLGCHHTHISNAELGAMAVSERWIRAYRDLLDEIEAAT